MRVPEMSDATIRALPTPGKTTDYYDGGRGSEKNLLLKISTGGAKTFYLLYRLKGKGSRQHKLGRYPALSLADARKAARRLAGELEKNPNFFTEKRQDEEDASYRIFSNVAEEFKKRHIEKKGLISGRAMWQKIEKFLLPKFRNRDIMTIKRKEITRLLDKIEDRSPSMADAVLAIYRSIAKFHALRDENYNSPIVPGMKRREAKSRDRTLNDDEIRAFWRATGQLGIFGGLCRVLLLTGQRRAKVAHMQHNHVQDGTWTLGHKGREKPNCGSIRLPALALSIIEAQPKIARNPFCFPGVRLGGPFCGWGQSTEDLLKLMRDELPDMPHFVLHDLRRTFRSRCSQLKIPREIAERCLGHVIGNQVERTYDRHLYSDEMTEAFQKIADHIAAIVTPPPASNVVRLSPAVQQRGGRRLPILPLPHPDPGH